MVNTRYIKELQQLIQNEIDGIKNGTIVLDAKRKQYTNKSSRQYELEKELEKLLPPKVSKITKKLSRKLLRFVILDDKTMMEQGDIFNEPDYVYFMDENTNKLILFDTEKEARIFLLENELNLENYDIVPYDIKLERVVYLRDYVVQDGKLI